MSRLTWKKKNGEWGLKGYDIKKVPRELYGYMCKLKDYEENELTEEKKQAIDDAYSEQAKEIAELKKRIVELEKENNDLRTIIKKQNKSEWIPVKYHYIEDDERKREGYPEDWVYYIDSALPDDEQEILITTKGGYVEYDTCYVDDDGYYLDGGRDWRDIIAWMPLPEPYKEKHVMHEEPIAMSQSGSSL